MRRLFLLPLAAAAVALALVATAPGSTAATTFTDPTGDSGGAPDITNVVVDNDAAGTITMTVTTANQADLATDALVDIIFDTDRNPATGSPSGGDYRVLIIGQTKSFGFLRWSGSQWDVAPGPTLQLSHSANTFHITINKSDLGGTAAFDFFLVGVQLSGDTVASRDDAPDGTAVWTYTLGAAPPPTTTTTPPPPPPPPPPTVGLGAVSLKAPGLHAGKLFSVRARVSTTATAVRVRCVVKVSGKALRVVGSYARATHIASCTGRAPVATAGKRLAGTMTVTISGDRDSKTFSFVIRV
jgi:hypothetical protein